MVYSCRDVGDIVREILDGKKDIGGVKNIYFVGCGGSLGALYPAVYFMQRESTLKCCLINSGEFIHSTPKDFSRNSVVCLSCHGGNTPETIAAARLGRERGAVVILLTWNPESEIAQYGDYIIRYAFDPSEDHMAGGIDYSAEKPLCALRVAAELTYQTEGYAGYQKMLEAYELIGGVIRRARAHVDGRARDFAKTYKDDPLIYTMASGAGYSAAYMESICIFMEMQWLDTSSIHTGEFFHGPLEVTDRNRPFLLQLSEGSTRVLDERALAFLQKYASRVEVLDAKDLGLSVIDSSVIDYFNHSLFNNVYTVYNHYLSIARQHPLSTRRYMWKVTY